MARAYKALPPASELWERFEYKPLTGDLLPKGAERRVARSSGYRVTWDGTRLCMTHRLIFKWVYGVEPVLDVDHRDGNPDNNRAWNLRQATKPQNMSNRKNTKGYERLPSGSFRARIRVNGKQLRLGVYPTAAEARAAYVKASLELHGEFSSAR